MPINALVPVEGTPLGDFVPPDVFQMARTIATARILMPKSMVRLSAGRMSFSQLEQSVMFMCGANSIFTGDKLLTTANPEFDEDTRMFEQLGLKGLKPNAVKSMEGRVTSADWVNPSAPTHAVAAS